MLKDLTANVKTVTCQMKVQAQKVILNTSLVVDSFSFLIGVFFRRADCEKQHLHNLSLLMQRSTESTCYLCYPCPTLNNVQKPVVSIQRLDDVFSIIDRSEEFHIVFLAKHPPTLCLLNRQKTEKGTVRQSVSDPGTGFRPFYSPGSEGAATLIPLKGPF